jgi:ABC-type Zn2+ transport system substrate-binding protein/surface adhesin
VRKIDELEAELVAKELLGKERDEVVERLNTATATVVELTAARATLKVRLMNARFVCGRDDDLAPITHTITHAHTHTHTHTHTSSTHTLLPQESLASANAACEAEAARSRDAEARCTALEKEIDQLTETLADKDRAISDAAARSSKDLCVVLHLLRDEHVEGVV